MESREQGIRFKHLRVLARYVGRFLPLQVDKE